MVLQKLRQRFAGAFNAGVRGLGLCVDSGVLDQVLRGVCVAVIRSESDSICCVEPSRREAFR